MKYVEYTIQLYDVLQIVIGVLVIVCVVELLFIIFYKNKSAEYMECVQDKDACQKSYKKCKEENKKLQDEKFDCQNSKNACVWDKDACQKDHEKRKEENKKLQDEKFDCQNSKNACVWDKDACQKDHEKCKEENKKLQDEKSNFIYCQQSKNTCVQDKDGCRKDYEKCKEENKKLQDEKSDCIYCQHSKDTCVRDKDACTQQLKEKKIKHKECLNAKENINEQMHRQCTEYQIKLTKCESSLQHTQTEASNKNKKDFKKYESCSKELEFVKSKKAKLEQSLNNESINFAHYKQKCANDLQFCKEKVQDCKSRIKKCAECEKEQLELTKHHYSLLMNLTVQCNIDKGEIYSLKAKIEEKEKYAVAKVNEFDKFWNKTNEREDGFINQLVDVKEKLAKCEQERDTNYEKYSECVDSKKWF